MDNYDMLQLVDALMAAQRKNRKIVPCPECERLRAALERIEVRGIEIISEHVGGSDASYVAQELTAIAREALREVGDD